MCVHVCVMGMWGVCEVEYMYDGSLLKFSSGLKRGGEDVVLSSCLQGRTKC